MSVASLNLEPKQIDGFDSIIIVKDLTDIPGGVTLNVENYTEDVIKAGHLLVQGPNGDIHPLPVVEGEYTSIGELWAYYGILKSSVLKSQPFAAVLRAGTVNAAAAAKFVGAPYPAEAIEALQRIDFLY